MSRPGFTIRRFNHRLYTLVFAVVTLSLTAGLIIVSLANAGKGVVSVFGSGGSGDGQFANAYGTAVNLSSGDVYVVDQFGYRVEQFDASGSFVRAFGWGVVDGTSAAQTCMSNCQAGVPGNGDGQFDTPQGIAVDQSDGSVYVVDGNNNRVEKFSATGVYQSQFGGAGNGDGQFTGPQGIVVAAGGAVYVADSGDHRIEKFNSAGVYLSQFGTEGSGDGQFEGPTRVAVDSTGQIYVLDAGNGRIERFTSAGAFDRVFDPTDVSAPQEIAVGPGNDHLYVAQWAQDFSEHHVIEIDGSGTLVDTHAVGSGANQSSGLALNAASQKIYLADGFNARVFILDDVTAPTVTIDPPTGVTSTGASLSGTVNPNGNPDVGWRFETSTDDANWSPTAADQDPGSGNAPVNVSQSLTGLVPNTTYFVRLVARRTFNAPAISTEVQIVTPAVGPEVTTEPAQDIAPSHAAFEGTVNPHHSPTTYFFEYGTNTAYGQRFPAADVDAGNANELVAAIERIDSLTPGTTYHYRIVATNQVDTVHGQDRTFTTTTAPPPSAARAGAPGAGFLPDNRGWELVSPADKNGNDVMIDSGRARAAADGDAASFAVMAGFGDVQGQGASAEYMSLRNALPGTSGWATHAITPRQDAVAPQWVSNDFDPRYEGELSPDLSRGIFRTSSPVTDAPNVATVGNLYMRDDLRSPGAGFYQLISACPVCTTPLSPITAFSPIVRLPRFAGASADFEHVLFESAHKLTADATADGSPSSQVNLYEWDHATVRLAGILPDGSAAAQSQAGPGASNEVYMPRVISADGSRIFFTDATTGNLYMRSNHSATTQLNASERTDCADHDPCNGTPEPDPGGAQGAALANVSADGSRAFFTSGEALTDDARINTSHLYMYDTNGPAGGRLHSLVPGDARVEGVIGSSDDGHYVYYIASSQPVAGQPHPTAYGIFLWHDGVTSYVGEQAGQDNIGVDLPGEWVFSVRYASRVTPDGRHLLFVSSNHVGPTGYVHAACDGTDCYELYVYDADTHVLRCASCDPGGAPASSNAVDNLRLRGTSTTWHVNRAVSENGRVFFDADAALVPEDVNRKIDVYEYSSVTGTVRLISSGRDPADSYFMDASASGDDVFFLSRERLVSWDHDQNYDMYDARVGGGLPEPVAPVPGCSGEACHGALGAAPGFVDPSTVSLSGLGDLKPVVKKVTSKSLTRAQKLKKALRKCKSKQKKSLRKKCELSAKKSFGRRK